MQPLTATHAWENEWIPSVPGSIYRGLWKNMKYYISIIHNSFELSGHQKPLTQIVLRPHVTPGASITLLLYAISYFESDI